MESFQLVQNAAGIDSVACPYRGQALLNQPMFNKGSAFSDVERTTFGLRGLLPATVNSLAQQGQRVYENISRKSDPVEKYIGLSALHDRNEILFYRVLLNHLEEFAPIIYTPTVGQACQEYSRRFREARGLWITPADRGRIDEVLADAPYDDVRLIVVTDNERILGLGDQGAGGMGIPVGKLALYSVAAGIHPSRTLPISLDVGTDNAALRADELYLGWNHPRLRGKEYDELVEEFVHAVKKRFPRALLQWEDFKQQNAFNLLERYREVIPSFNDDIQGTAAVAVAGILAGVRATGSTVSQQRVVMLGSGAAGIGIARQIRDLMIQAGLSGTQLTTAIAMLDSKGLVIAGDHLAQSAKQEFAWPVAAAAKFGLASQSPADLLTVVNAIHPTVLIGTSGTSGTFSEPVVRAMARGTGRPIIFPLSNPTSKAEAIPADLIRWTDGNALVATGSPFSPVNFNGRTFRIGQGNNVYIFPGIGLGVLVSQAKIVIPAMFNAAARALADHVSQEDLDAGALYPPLAKLRDVTASIACAVVKVARGAGIGRTIADEEVMNAVRAEMWTPDYPELVPV
jgi:malic enzyme